MDEKQEAECLLDELDLGPTPRINGALRVPFVCEYSRDLTEADIAALQGPRGSTPKSLARISASHHSVARCLATGMKPNQVALVTGYTPTRISVLQHDPAFSALVEDYRTEARSVFADLADRMNDISLDAIELLHERLQDKPSDFSVPMLLDVIKAFADRTGHGPGQDVNIKLSADLIDRPPRETYEDWQKRRGNELAPPRGNVIDMKKLN